MTQSSNKLAALGRIILAIKRFRQLAADSKMASVACKDDYLRQYLSDQDWLIWEQLQEDPQEMPLNEQEPLTTRALSTQQFSLLLKQYKRAGFEMYQAWHQTHQYSLSNHAKEASEVLF